MRLKVWFAMVWFDVRYVLSPATNSPNCRSMSASPHVTGKRWPATHGERVREDAHFITW